MKKKQLKKSKPKSIDQEQKKKQSSKKCGTSCTLPKRSECAADPRWVLEYPYCCAPVDSEPFEYTIPFDELLECILEVYIHLKNQVLGIKEFAITYTQHDDSHVTLIFTIEG